MPRKAQRRIRYAVVGLGHIAQNAVLPAFAHARGDAELVALVSDTDEKLKALSRRYRTRYNLHYDDYDRLLASGEIDAVYIAVPNNLHKDFTIRAATHGVHVLCEKPMALDAAECEEMIQACRAHGVRLMIAYRLHFEEANLNAIELVQRGRIGEARIFNSVFSEPVAPGNIRTQRKLGGGPLFDIGIYCVNAARYIFQAEPESVEALGFRGGRKALMEVGETVSAILRFPEDRVATFTCSFGAARSGWYQVVGTKGDLMLENAYEYEMPARLRLTVAGRRTERGFRRHDQFAPELIYFSECIRRGIEPEPSGVEGLADLRVIDAIEESARLGRALLVPSITKWRRPSLSQLIRRPPVRAHRLIAVQAPTRKTAA